MANQRDFSGLSLEECLTCPSSCSGYAQSSGSHGSLLVSHFFRIGRTRISVADEDNAIQTVLDAVRNKQKGYVCISSLRTVPIANKDDKYWEVIENSLMNAPDGTPLVWCGHWWGLKQVQRACGPHIFPRILKMKNAGLKHFFMGDTEGTLVALTKKQRRNLEPK